MTVDKLIARVARHQRFLQTHAGIDSLYHQKKVNQYTRDILATTGEAALDKLWETINEPERTEVGR